MNRLVLLFSVLITLNATAKINNNSNEFNSEESELEKILFVNIEDSSFESIDINSIEVIEIEEEVELGFDTANYLPKDFNALKGMHDLDWASIELVELEEEIEICFDTAKYLPKDFNALKDISDSDSHKIQLVLIDIQEEFDYSLNMKTLCSLN